MEENQSFELKAGNPAELRIPIVDADTGQPYSLTGKTLRYALSEYDRTGRFKSDPVFEKDNAGLGGISIDPQNDNIMIVTYDPADTANLVPVDDGRFFQEGDVIEAGEPITLFEGDVTLRRRLLAAP